jgi:hypothetical protein
MDGMNAFPLTHVRPNKNPRLTRCLCWFVCLGWGVIGWSVLATNLEAAPPSAEGIAYFEKHIRPLLVKQCYSCHSLKSGESDGGLLLDSRAGWVAGGENGPTIVAGDVEASLLIRAIRHDDSELKMPPEKRLSGDEIRLLENWIKIGAPDPRDGRPTAQPLVDDPSDPVAGREHWAFRPLQRPAPPVVANSNAAWVSRPVDSFVLAQLEEAGLSPAATADRGTLARRVTIQLTGLPPTPQELAAFLLDDRHDAYERLVDRLISSPRFGEQWGRHWLDLARYADSNGLDENFLFREAWRYRNWVVEAINADMPYHQFIAQQIAGDLLPFENIEQRDRQRIASGFLVVGPKVLLGVDVKKQRMDVADEQVDTIGRAILAQTIGCARCHDHKFDPIPTADYYALAGIFTSTEVMQKRHMLGQQRVMERLVGLGPDGDTANENYEQFWREKPKLQERAKQAKSAFDLLKKDDLTEFDEFAKKHADSLAAGAANSELSKDERIKRQKTLVETLATSLAKPPAIPPRAMISGDGNQPADEHIRIAGRFDQIDEKVSRGFLRVVSDQEATIPPEQSGRMELAHWLTDVERGAGNVAARVLANRVWHHMIGTGIVRTADNFGRTGEAASHPELLDYLANELIESDWSIKHLVRTIALSHTFTQSSRHKKDAHAIDPENRFLWRAHRRRLTPEALRDAMLLAAGELDMTPLDSSVSYLGDQATAVGANKVRRRTDFPNRSIYLPVIRNDLPELFEVFDFADPHTATGLRPQTTVATQGLYLLNNDAVLAASEATARRLLATEDPEDAAKIVDNLYELVLGAVPTDAEIDEIGAYVNETKRAFATTESDEKDLATLSAWSTVCQALFASSRFQILE